MDEDQEADTVARTLYGEARGEGRQGMVAVACVILNRADIASDYIDEHDKPHPLFGDGSLSAVCLAPLQFSTWNEGDPNRAIIQKVTLNDAVFLSASEIAREAVEDELDDVTHSATHYYDSRMPKPPEWAEGKVPSYVYGHHLFFNDID